MKLCDYGCGQEAKYQFKNGKWCCSESHNSCPNMKKINSLKGGHRRGVKDSEETKKRKSESKKGLQVNEKNPLWKGGYNKRNIPRYDHFEKKLYLIEKIRRNKFDKNILEVRCAYCGKWCIPKETEVHERIRSVENFGDTRLYCSDKCKKECPIYKQCKYPRDHKPATSREVQPELRQMRFKIDNYTCKKCGKHQDELDVALHCHHVEGIRWEPLESADLDKVITLCKDCHLKVHKIEGCGYNDMKCPEENK
jgi:hypothetical protein